MPAYLASFYTFFPRHEFYRAVRRNNTEHGSKGFACWDQFVAMMFCQLAQAKSLREICGGLKSCLGKVVHLGMNQAPKRSTLAYANGHRPWQLYQDVFYELLGRCQDIAPRHRFRFRNKLRALAGGVVLQGGEAEPEDQDLRGNIAECFEDADLDSIDCDSVTEVPSVDGKERLVIVEPRGLATLELVHPQGPVEMAG